MLAHYHHTHFASLDSTLDEAARLLSAGKASHGTLITAAEQTKGRGRHGRVWTSKPGNLHAALVLQPPNDPEIWSQLNFVMALALADTLRMLLPARSITLKWPNDVLVGGKKISGLLLEKAPQALVIGFGVNCVSHPDATATPATNLREQGAAKTEPHLVLEGIVESFDSLYRLWLKEGFAPIRKLWLKQAQNVGAAITVQQGGRQLSGIFTDIAPEDGTLLVSTADGALVRIATGDVYFEERGTGNGE